MDNQIQKQIERIDKENCACTHTHTPWSMIFTQQQEESTEHKAEWMKGTQRQCDSQREVASIGLS